MQNKDGSYFVTNPAQPVRFTALPVQPPRRAILDRLGYREGVTQLSPAETARLECEIAAAFRHCRPQGVYTTAGVSAADTAEGIVTLDGGWQIRCAGVAKMFADSGARCAWLAAATVGAEITQIAAEAIANGDAAKAAIADAVGSECADAALDLLAALARQQLRPAGGNLQRCRFSPGYGGWQLSDQTHFFERLQLAELGITLTPSYIMSPEKSVTAIAPIC